MNSTQMKLFLPLFVVIVLGFCFTTTKAQTPSVEATLNFADYDVIYLADFIDMKTQKLSSTIPSITLDLVVQPESMSAALPVCLYIETDIQLRGDPGLKKMVSGYTSQFLIAGRKTLSARDFTKDGPLPLLNAGYEEDKPLRQRLEDLATTIPTAPPGTYQITMVVYSPDKSKRYGSTTKTIVIPFSAPDEAFVEINEPKNGSFFTNLAPTFSWTTSVNSIKVSVFEAGVNHRSPQDALTGGNPYLVKELTGATSLTYPQDAYRQLQENKAYVLQVEANVTTNRGKVGNSSRPIVFRITNDNVGKILDNFLSTAAGSTSGTFSTLRADPTNWVAWQDYGNMTLDGSMLTETDLQTLLHDLANNPDLNLQLSVENQ